MLSGSPGTGPVRAAARGGQAGAQVPECIGMMQAWIQEMGAYVKALDPHHLVTVGAEGFWAPVCPPPPNPLAPRMRARTQ